MIEYYDGKIDEYKIRPEKTYGEFVLTMIIGFVLLITFWIMCINGIYYFADFNITDSIRVMFLMGCGTFLVVFLLCDAYICYKLNYELHTYGIKVIHPFKHESIVFWEEFQEICICYAHRRGNCAYVVIAFVKNGAKRNLMKRWKTDRFLHHKKIIVMDYTEELLEQVKNFYKKDVPDLRETKEYKLLARVYHENKWLS